VPSKSQIDKLGERLRIGVPDEVDLRELDEYRRSFGPAYEQVVGEIRHQLVLEPTGRPAKSTPSIVDKLRRESIRLTQIQDIAGCRIVVADVIEQDRILGRLMECFRGASLVDRRNKPSHGYRAVHVMASIAGRTVEIQLRTTLQQKWAELSEKLSDVIDATIKYGGGAPVFRTFLDSGSERIASLEEIEVELTELLPPTEREFFRAQVERLKMEEAKSLSDLIADIEQRKRLDEGR
jgi:putative GTP pyrophosphokinase